MTAPKFQVDFFVRAKTVSHPVLIVRAVHRDDAIHRYDLQAQDGTRFSNIGEYELTSVSDAEVEAYLMAARVESPREPFNAIDMANMIAGILNSASRRLAPEDRASIQVTPLSDGTAEVLVTRLDGEAFNLAVRKVRVR